MFTIEIDQFNGPLDLMLFLIKEKKLDLFDLDMAILIDQYQSYLFTMQERSLEIASEYLSELAGLIEYKSKKLIPRDKSELDANAVEDEKESLVRRLIEYQRFKEVSLDLSIRYDHRQLLVSKPFEKQSVSHLFTAETSISNDAYDLLKAMRKVMHRLSLANPFETKLTSKELSVDQRIDMLRRTLSNKHDSFLLEDLFADCSSVQMMIVTFLAVLDMIRMGELTFTSNEDQIYLLRSDEYDTVVVHS